MSATYTNFYIRPAGSTRQKDLMYAIRNEKELQDPLPEELGEYFQKEMRKLWYVKSRVRIHREF